MQLSKHDRRTWLGLRLTRCQERGLPFEARRLHANVLMPSALAMYLNKQCLVIDDEGKFMRSLQNIEVEKKS